jgi:hypothetical protein
MLPFSSLIAFSARASFVISTNALAWQPGIAIHDDMDLGYLPVDFEQPPKLRLRHLRIQVPNKEVFHDVSPTDNFSIVGRSGVARQEDEVERRALDSAFPTPSRSLPQWGTCPSKPAHRP